MNVVNVRTRNIKYSIMCVQMTASREKNQNKKNPRQTHTEALVPLQGDNFLTSPPSEQDAPSLTIVGLMESRGLPLKSFSLKCSYEREKTAESPLVTRKRSKTTTEDNSVGPAGVKQSLKNRFLMPNPCFDWLMSADEGKPVFHSVYLLCFSDTVNLNKFIFGHFIHICCFFMKLKQKGLHVKMTNQSLEEPGEPGKPQQEVCGFKPTMFLLTTALLHYETRPAAAHLTHLRSQKTKLKRQQSNKAERTKNESSVQINSQHCEKCKK